MEGSLPKFWLRDGTGLPGWGWFLLTLPFINVFNPLRKEQSLSENNSVRILAIEWAANIANNHKTLFELPKDLAAEQMIMYRFLAFRLKNHVQFLFQLFLLNHFSQISKILQRKKRNEQEKSRG